MLSVTCDSSFAGSFVSCTDGITTLTETCPESSPYIVKFSIPNGGIWTISCGTSSISIIITDTLDLYNIPVGATVSTLNDIQTWLHCAGIYDKSYTTISEVLNDSTTLTTLINSNNASDYLVRSTNLGSSICANSTAMDIIGSNDYCSTKLLNNTTWKSAIFSSSYWAKVLNGMMPVMVSATAPYGQCRCSSGNATAGFLSSWYPSSGGQHWFGYEFPKNITIYRYYIRLVSSFQSGDTSFKIQGSNDNSSWTDLTDIITKSSGSSNLSYSGYNNITKNIASYKYYRVYFTTGMYQSGSRYCTAFCQFYGRY